MEFRMTPHRTKRLRRKPPVIAWLWRGDVAQQKFIARAMSMNLAAATFLSNCLPFDAVVASARKLYRVQIKHTTFPNCDSWRLAVVRTRNQPYKPGDFHFLAALAPGDVWYIIPFKAIAGMSNISLPRTNRSKNHFARYRERWDLFV
jgi:hypothetical protein